MSTVKQWKTSQHGYPRDNTNTNRRGIVTKLLFSSWSFFTDSFSASPSTPVTLPVPTIFTLSFSNKQQNNTFVSYFIMLQSFYATKYLKPAVNSTPANSAVSKNSSSVFCSVIDCKFNLFQSYPSWTSLVCSLIN